MNFFIRIVEASIIAGVGILIYYMISTLFRTRFTFKYKKAIWVLIVLRLLIPYHVINLPGAYTLEIPNVVLSQIRQSVEVVEKESVQGKTEVLNKEIGSIEREEKTVYSRITLNMVSNVVWAVGMTVFMFYFGLGYILFYRKVLKNSSECRKEVICSLAEKTALELKLKRIPQIRILKNMNIGPFTVGVRKHTVFLPDKDYMETDMQYIFRHEMIHCRQRDVLCKLILLVVSIIHWFNPTVWLFRNMVEKEMELTCDDKVLKNATMEERKEYSEVIMSCIIADKTEKPIAATGYTYNSTFMKQRFQNIFQMNKKNGNVLVIGVLFLLLITNAAIQIKEGTSLYHLKEIPIDFGHEIKTDINGDGIKERVWVSDNAGWTQILAEFENGDIFFTDFDDYWSSSLVSGDLNNDGAADIVLIRISIGSTYGGGNVTVLHGENKTWEFYPNTFIRNPSLDMEQPKSFAEEDFNGTCMGATILEKNGQKLLRLIMPEDMVNDVVKCVDCSYRENGWYIEDIQIVSDYYGQDKEKELLANNFRIN